VFKVIELGANREPVYDFLLVINSNLGPISFHLCDERTDGQTNRWTDRIVMAKMPMKAVAAFAR